jgi:hypothetical protein
MQTAFVGALLLGLALAGALFGASTASLFSPAQTFHPGFFRRWLRRIAVSLFAAGIAAGGAALILQITAFAQDAPSLALTAGAALWLVILSAFGFGYRFANGRRMTKALDAGLAVGLH